MAAREQRVRYRNSDKVIIEFVPFRRAKNVSGTTVAFIIPTLIPVMGKSVVLAERRGVIVGISNAGQILNVERRRLEVKFWVDNPDVAQIPLWRLENQSMADITYNIINMVAKAASIDANLNNDTLWAQIEEYVKKDIWWIHHSKTNAWSASNINLRNNSRTFYGMVLTNRNTEYQNTTYRPSAPISGMQMPNRWNGFISWNRNIL